MQTPEPSPEHHWLLQLVGDWDFSCECSMGPDQPPLTSTGKQSTTSMGSIWILGEMQSFSPEGQPDRSLMTLGYDPAKKRFVGTFVTSCMTHMWPYDGQLDATGKVLTLDSEGPGFAGDGSMARYQDVFEIIDRDHYLLKSSVLNPDGSWKQFMSGKYTRAGK
jgi:Protein of unknown function (DUF1579)